MRGKGSRQSQDLFAVYPQRTDAGRNCLISLDDHLSFQKGFSSHLRTISDSPSVYDGDLQSTGVLEWYLG
jgi:hypothetical protein